MFDAAAVMDAVFSSRWSFISFIIVLCSLEICSLDSSIRLRRDVTFSSLILVTFLLTFSTNQVQVYTLNTHNPAVANNTLIDAQLAPISALNLPRSSFAYICHLIFERASLLTLPDPMPSPLWYFFICS